MRILVSWLDRDEVLAGHGAEPSPLTHALAHAAKHFDQIVLLDNLPTNLAHRYVQSLACKSKVEVVKAPIQSPVDYGEIHLRAVEAVEALRARNTTDLELTFFLNSGTAPMGSVWLLLGKSRYDAKLIAWSTHSRSVETINVPFEISAEFIPTLLERADTALRDASLEPALDGAAFTNIVGQCRPMKELLARARRVAVHNVPVLLEGESGTGKEILARAIHGASPRRKGPFIAVNCGAIPENLAESELFGHIKGAFTGAEQPRAGHFLEAHGGTLFLDEIGELPLRVQVKLLRPLQEAQIVHVGTSKSIKVDVRVIAATHRSLIEDVSKGLFREDLFYRLAVAVLKVPPLRQREGDVSLLIDHVLKEINEAAGTPRCSLSPSARNRLLWHTWPGNVRELANTLRRAVVWSSRSTLDGRDIEEALLPATIANAGLLDRSLGAGFHLDDVLAEVQAFYIKKALDASGGRKVEASRLLGLNSHQVLANRMRKERSTRRSANPRGTRRQARRS